MFIEFQCLAYTRKGGTMNDRLSFLYELIGCSYPIEHWIYHMDGHLIESNSQNERILDVLFSIGGIKDYMLSYAKEHTMPLVLSSTLGNLWIAVFEPASPDINATRCHVLGPVFTDTISTTHIQNRVNSYDMPVSFKNSFIKLVRTFPAVPWTTLIQYAIMLHYTLTGCKISSSDFSYQTDLGSHDRNESPASEESEKKNLPWMAEQALLSNIREGNLNYQTALSAASSVSTGVQINTGDPMRKAKTSGSCFCALAARAAIEGGLSAQSAYTLQNLYTQSIEAASSISEIATINHQMYEDFIRRVHKLKETPGISPQVRSCQEYIEMHAAEKISIQNLAETVGYTDYYLSRKFKTETGISINEYIKLQKIREAKSLLVATQMSIQDISDHLNFCSRSYFADTFKKTVGISPADYRSQNQKM